MIWKLIVEFFTNLFSKKESVLVTSNNDTTEVIETNNDITQCSQNETNNEQNEQNNITIEVIEEKDKNTQIEVMKNPKYDNWCVCLDNGHASTTPGKRSPYSLRKIQPELPLEEWKFTRDVVALTAEKLKEEGIEVFIVTPETDLDVALSIRARRANDYIKSIDKKGLFISVHVDAHGDGTKWMSGNGWSCWTTKGQNNSDKFADCLYDAAEEIIVPLGRKIRTEKTDGDRDWESDFTVIYKAAMPAVLTENLFQTNIEDCTFLNSEEGKEAIAKLHVEGIKKYIEKYES